MKFFRSMGQCFVLLGIVSLASCGGGDLLSSGSSTELAPANESVDASQSTTIADFIEQAGADPASVLRGVPIRQTAVGNDPAFGFAGTKEGGGYEYYPLPSMGELNQTSGRRESVKIAVVPMIYADNYDNIGGIDEADLEAAKKAAKRLPLDVLQDVLFSKNLAGSEHWEKGLGISPPGSLFEYFREASNGKLLLEGKVFNFDDVTLTQGSSYDGWYVPEDLTDYNPMANLTTIKYAMAEALAQIDDSSGSNIEYYDNADRWIGTPGGGGEWHDCIVFILAIPDRDNKTLGAVAWHFKTGSGMGNLSVNSKAVRSAIAIPAYPAGNGAILMETLAHEIGHAMGLPDTYDRFDSYESPLISGGIGSKSLTEEDYIDAHEDFDLSKVLKVNQEDYNSSNRGISHYSVYEKILLGWIDTLVLMEPEDQPGVAELKTVYDSEALVMFSENGSAVHRDSQLFSQDDLFIVIENRGERDGIVRAMNGSSPALDSDGNPIEYVVKFEGNSGGLYGQLVDASRADEDWIEDYADNPSRKEFNNLYRRIYFDNPVIQQRRTKAVGGDYFSPYIGIAGIGSIPDAIVPEVINDLVDGPCLYCFNSPAETIDNSVRLQLWPENPKQLMLVGGEIQTDVATGGNAEPVYSFSANVWDTEFSHAWPDAPGSAAYGFSLTINRLEGQGGAIDDEFDPLFSTDIAHQFRITKPVDDLLGPTESPGTYWYRAELVNTNPRSTGRSTAQNEIVHDFPLTLVDPIDFDSETPFPLDITDEAVRSMLIPEGQGKLGSEWRFITDNSDTVAYCGRVDGSGNPLGYESNLDLRLLYDVPLSFSGTGPWKIKLNMRHQIEKAIVLDSVNWEAVGHAGLNSNLEEHGVDGTMQVRGDHLQLQIANMASDTTDDDNWVSIPYQVREPSGESGYTSYYWTMNSAFLNQQVLNLLATDSAGCLRMRFISDDSVQYAGVFVEEIILGAN